MSEKGPGQEASRGRLKTMVKASIARYLLSAVHCWTWQEWDNMLKRKSYWVAALIVNTVIFRGGRSSGTLGRRILVCRFCQAARTNAGSPRSLRLDIFALLPDVTAAKPALRKDIVWEDPSMFEVILIDLIDPDRGAGSRNLKSNV